MKKAVISIDRWTVLVKISKARTYIEEMGGNPFFPTPEPALDDVTNAANALEAAHRVYESNGGKKDKLDMDAKNLILDNLLRRLGLYVTLVANGKEEVIHSAGMEPSKEKQPVGPMTKIFDVKLRTSDVPGVLLVDFKAQEGARCYVIQINISPGNESLWEPKLIIPRSKKLQLTGLVSGTKYGMRVAAVGTAGQGPWSDVVTQYAH
jgi:hypothetical protein